MGDHRPNSADSRTFGTGPGVAGHRPRLAALLAARHVRDPADARPTRSWPRPAHESGAVNPALAGVALAVIVGGRRRRVRPERPDRDPRAGRRPGRRPVPRRSPARSARRWPPVSSRPSSPATCCGSPRAVIGRATGGSPRRLADRCLPGVGRGRGRVRQRRARGARGGTRRWRPRQGSRWRRSRSLPVVTGRDILRVGIGLMLLLSGALLVRTHLGGTPDPLEQLITAGLVAALGGAVAILGGRGAVGRRRRVRAERNDAGPDRSDASDAHPAEPQ